MGSLKMTYCSQVTISWLTWLPFHIFMMMDYSTNTKQPFLSQSIKYGEGHQRLQGARSSWCINDDKKQWKTTNQRDFRAEPIYQRARSMADLYFQLKLESIRSGTNGFQWYKHNFNCIVGEEIQILTLSRIQRFCKYDLQILHNKHFDFEVSSQRRFANENIFLAY